MSQQKDEGYANLLKHLFANTVQEYKPVGSRGKVKVQPNSASSLAHLELVDLFSVLKNCLSRQKYEKNTQHSVIQSGF